MLRWLASKSAGDLDEEAGELGVSGRGENGRSGRGMVLDLDLWRGSLLRDSEVGSLQSRVKPRSTTELGGGSVR
jgi:hypothetical protein